MDKPLESMRLKSIDIKSLVNPHQELPPDIQIFAQLMIDGNILEQTEAMGWEISEESCSLKFECMVPIDAPVFSVAIMRSNPCTRLLGSVEISRGDALVSVEHRSALCLPLGKVNPDGPSLEFSAIFESLTTESSAFDVSIMPIRLGSLNNHIIEACLRHMHRATDGPLQLPFPKLWVLHERILLLSSTNEHRAQFLHILGDICFRRKQDIDALNRAVCAYSDAMRDAPNVAMYRRKLGVALFDRFNRLHNVQDINQSVVVFREALSLTHSDRTPPFNLGNILQSRFEWLGDLDDLEAAISMFKEAILLLPGGHPYGPLGVQNLGNALLLRFERLGDLSDLNEAVWALAEAVRLLPIGHPERATVLENFGTEAVTLAPTVGERASGLASLGTSLLVRFERLGNLDNLNESIQVSGEAVTMCSSDDVQRKSSYLNGLANSFRRRFQHLGNMNDLDQAILAAKQAITFLPHGHPSRAWRLMGLGNTLRNRFSRLNNLADLNDAISAQEEALILSPDDHSSKVSLLYNLADNLKVRYEELGDNDVYDQMIGLYELAACSNTGFASARFAAAVMWAELQKVHKLQKISSTFDDVSSALERMTGPYLGPPELSPELGSLVFRFPDDPDRGYLVLPPEILIDSLPAYTAALDLLPELTWLGSSIEDRHHRISPVGEVIRNAAATAIGTHQYGKAIEWLEQGRSIIWGQILELRTSVNTLKEEHPALAEKFVALSSQLDSAAKQDEISGAMCVEQESETQSYHGAAHSWNLLLKQIRALDKFERFLLPKTMSELSLAAKHGPVVILSIEAVKCVALVLVPGLDEKVFLLYMEMPDFRSTDARSLGESLRSLLHGAGRGERLAGQLEGKIDSEAEFASILSQLWIQVAKPVLEGLHLNTPSRENLPRIWWCPTGPLTSLPIHAAGLYGEDDIFGSKLSDFVISSYTPSLTALIEGFRERPHSQEGIQLLAGHSNIPGTGKEVDNIQRLSQATADKIPVIQLVGNDATVESIQHGMKSSSWVHFACHGVQNISEPTKSALLLTGGSRLTLSSIIKMSLPQADFAFLSACQTATGTEALQEESVHLAAGMLLAGYRSVIGTMWAIGDDDAPQVAEDVYKHLFKTSPPDPTRAAEALHLAVGKLRKSSGGKKSFFHWVPFIHLGA
ncbi:CHAT domain-containing protein [Mycena rosella]|uniref:CHAT domain-containing protein n=1 Tax=Mycena rosella TaxID=1033263 RepID=A0AAD7CLM8_MYCRO|nr:CHAT domain-containing protein [Mycena rosella]